MWHLDLRKYSPVLVKQTPILPWIVHPRGMLRLEENAGFVKSLKKHYSKDVPGLMSWLKDHFNHNEIVQADVLEQLGLQTLGSIPGSMIEPEIFKTFMASADLILPTEKFYSKPFLSMGSSRHVLLKDIQLKGVGRNNLCLDEDYYHSWGGCVSRDALKGYLAALVADKKSKLGSLPILGMFIYPEENPENPPLAIVARDSQTYRLSQLDTNFLTETDIQVTKLHLEKSFKDMAPQQILEVILDHYIHAYSVGLIHRSPSRENLLIDGRWIDTESLDFTIEQKPAYPWIKICCPHSDKNIQPEPLKNLSETLNEAQNLLHFDNWVHHLYMMCELTYEAYSSLWPSEISDLKGTFKKIFLKYFSADDYQFWLEQFSDLPSFNQMNFTRTQKDKLRPVKEPKEIINQLAHYKCIGHYYDILQSGSVYTFAPVEEDIHVASLRLLRKWEAYFWPKDLDWKKAHENAEKIESTLNEMFS